MSKGNQRPRSMRRRLYLLGVLLFLSGLMIGCCIGFWGIRYFLFRFRPSMDSIANKRALQIQRDLGLTDDVREQILRESESFFKNLRTEGDAMRDRLDGHMEAHTEAVADLMPTPEKREQWLKDSWKYFPPPPPRGGPPHPPPPGGPGFFGGPPPPHFESPPP